MLGPAMFYAARRVVVLLRYYGRIVYDRDLLFVRQLPPRPLLIDVGANAGQSALSMALVRPDARIVSFEPNAGNVKDLAIVRRILGDRYSYHHVGLSNHNGTAVLNVPWVGRTPVPGESSFLEAFDESTERRIGKIAGVRAQEVEVRTFDSYGLRPDFIKIDVQGHELEVLHGMAATIAACQPILMLERGFHFQAIRDHLRTLGYVFGQMDQETGRLIRSDAPKGVNYFATPNDRGQRHAMTHAQASF